MRRLHVAHEMILSEVRFITDGTEEGFEAHVLERMTLQIRALSEFCIAIRTAIRYMSVNSVMFQIAQRVEDSMTLVAWKIANRNCLSQRIRTSTFSPRWHSCCSAGVAMRKWKHGERGYMRVMVSLTVTVNVCLLGERYLLEAWN